MSLVTLAPPAELARAYRAPGQYIEVRASVPGYFVLAGPIGAPHWELLVRSAGGASDLLSSAPEGTSFEVTAPLGDGFPVARASGRRLALAVVGTASAIARPILRERIGSGAAPSTYVYIGARSAADVPLGPEVERWASAGARVVVCRSRAPYEEPPVLAGVRRESGWVQDVVAADLASGRLPRALVFAAGPAEMLEAMRALVRGPAGQGTAGAEELDLEIITNV